MAEKRQGRQTPTASLILPYRDSSGQDAVKLYNTTGRTAQQWQELLLYDILARDEDGLWVHTKFGYEVPRRNGKNEIAAARELWGLTQGENILHTAHRTTTSAAASKRLSALLSAAGYEEVQRPKKGKKYKRAFTYTKQLGLECITLLGPGGGVCSFRTRSAKGGLGEGFDLLVIDEAQEYRDDQESALKYVVSDSPNPQTLFCGTPPTLVSSGTVFQKLRAAALQGRTKNTGWAEWSVEYQTDPHDVEAWYETNPSLGTILTERKIEDEIGDDPIDFNIQRLGLWLTYNQKSAISAGEWAALKCAGLPELTGRLFAGVKYSPDGANVALSIAVHTADGRIFVEAIDCRSVRTGTDWLVAFLSAADVEAVAVDGASGQQLLSAAMTDAGLEAPLLPTVKQIVAANAVFEQGVFQKHLCHAGQPSVEQVATNCEKRAIGTGGGFGYRSILAGADIALLDSIALAYWQAHENKTEFKQFVRY